MRKYLIIAAFCTSFLILFGWMSQVALTAKKAPTVKLAITGYDPRDLLSGHYIQFQIDWDKSDCTQFTPPVCPKDRFGRAQRFYIPEEFAPALDRRFRSSAFRGGASAGKQDVFEVVYAYPKNAKPTPRQLLINGKDWRETIKPMGQ